MLQDRKCTKCGTTSTPQWRNPGPNVMCNACGIKEQAVRRKAAKRSAEEHVVTPVKSAKMGQDGNKHQSQTYAPNLPSILTAIYPSGNMLTPGRTGVRADPATQYSLPALVSPAPATVDLSLGVPFDLFDIPFAVEEQEMPQPPNNPPACSRGSLKRQIHQPCAGHDPVLRAPPHMMACTGHPHEAPGTQATDKEATRNLQVEQRAPHEAHGNKFVTTPAEGSGENAKAHGLQAGDRGRGMPVWPSIQSFMPWDISAPADPSSHLTGTTGIQSLRLAHKGRTVVEPAPGRVVKTLVALPDVQLLHQSCAGSSGVVLEHVCSALTLTLQLVLPNSPETTHAGCNGGASTAAKVLARVSMSHERSGVVVAYVDDVQSGGGRRVPHLVRGCPAWESGDGWAVLFSDPSQLEVFMGAITHAPEHIKRYGTQG